VSVRTLAATVLLLRVLAVLPPSLALGQHSGRLLAQFADDLQDVAGLDMSAADVADLLDDWDDMPASVSS